MHLHGRHSAAAFLGSIKKYGLHPVEFSDYYPFSKYLTADCPKNTYERISWQYTPDKISLCLERFHKYLFHLLENFCRQLFLDVSDKKDVTVKIELFQSIWVKTRFNDDKKRLKYTSTYASICFITDFMKELLPKTIHHLNGLQHFRSVVPEFNQVFHGVYWDLLILIKSHYPNERGGSIYLLNSGNRKCQL